MNCDQTEQWVCDSFLRQKTNEAWEKKDNVGHHVQNQFHLWNTFRLKMVDGTANCNRSSRYFLYYIKEVMEN